MKKLLSLILLLSFNIKAQDVKIGKQTWATKNLNVSTYRNGDKIPQVQDAAVWVKLTTGAWCYYENKAENGAKYGKLYNWYAVNDPRGLAPKGYVIPNDAEWTMLTDYLGAKAGIKMKTRIGWKNNGNGTNESGFAALPGGSRDFEGDFVNVGAAGNWWISSEDYWPLYRDLWCEGNVGKPCNFKWSGESVRCIKE